MFNYRSATSDRQFASKTTRFLWSEKAGGARSLSLPSYAQYSCSVYFSIVFVPHMYPVLAVKVDKNEHLKVAEAEMVAVAQRDGWRPNSHPD